MSIIQRSSVQSGPIFLKAIAAWVSGDITSTQILCLQCLEGLRYNPAFPHLAACLYFLAFCAKSDNKARYASDVLDCLQDKCDAKALRISIPWRMLESFNGTSKSFFELANTSKDHPRSPSPPPPPPPPPHLPKCNGQSEAASDADESPCLNGGECNGVVKKDEVTSCQDDYFASPAWYHPYDCLTPENYETLALFCLEMGQRELGLAFAVRAHQESRSRESPDLIENCTTTSSSFSSPSSPSSPQLPCLSLRLLRSLDPPLLPDFPSEDDDSDPTGDSSLSINDIGAPFDVNFMGCDHDEDDDDDDEEEEEDEAAASAPDWENGHTPLREPPPPTTPACESPCPGVRMRVHGSILKTPTSPDCERLYSEKAFANGALNSPRVEKHVRFSLSASHPPPDLEAEYGGRSNSRRIQDMARRRGNYADHSYDSLNAAGAMDRFVGVFWPDLRRRSLAKRLLDLATFMVFLSVILAFSLLFLSLVICIPLAWLTSADSAAGACTVADMCVWLLNGFGLRTLMAV